MTTRKTAVEYNLTAKFSDFERVKICSSRDASDYIRNFYQDDMNIYESVFILLLNRSNQTSRLCENFTGRYKRNSSRYQNHLK